MGKRKGHSLNKTNACQARSSNNAVHYKNTTEAANVIRGMTVVRATAYLKNVIAHKECVPFKIFRGGIGRCAQAKNFKMIQGRWPQKSAKALLNLLRNAISNAEYMEMETENLIVESIQVNKAHTLEKRTYRAHGRITFHCNHRCHLQVVLSEKDDS